MTREEYTAAVNSVLMAHTASAVSRLNAVLARIPAQAKRISIEIFVDADGEGFLDIRIRLDGPDSLVLNRAIAETADLFETRMVDGEMEPDLPLMEPDGEEFPVQDALADIAAGWVTSVWSQSDHSRVALPATVEVHDGYGTLTPIQLKK